MKAFEIAEIIERTAPRCLAEGWDNVGLMIGDPNCEVSRVLTTLDVTRSVAKQAVEQRCNMILSHHPMFFGGVKSIDFSKPEGGLIKDLICANIAVYAFHTNLDCAVGGINDYLAKLFSLTEVSVLSENVQFPNTGIGRVGMLPTPIFIDELCELVKIRLKTPFVRVVNGSGKRVKRIAVASGSCAEYIPKAANMGAEVIVTADMKYHDSLSAQDLGICVIDAGHYPTEICAAEIFAELLSGCNVEIHRAISEDVFKIC